MLKKRILFVFNAKAGVKRKLDLAGLITQHLDCHAHDYEIYHCDCPEKWRHLPIFLAEQNFDTVVACGGDGTVNSIAGFILGTKTRLAIIPLGSGNGLARSIGTPMSIPAAIRQVTAGNTRLIDAWKINQQAFFCTAGVGFDAHVSGLFVNLVQRGLWSYIKLVVRAMLRYRAKNYHIQADDISGAPCRQSCRALCIVLANASQYGNNIFVAPEAKMDDGYLHIVIIRPISIWAAPYFIWQVLRKQVHQSRFVQTMVAQSVCINSLEKLEIHYDGEPVLHESEGVLVERGREQLCVIS